MGRDFTNVPPSATKTFPKKTFTFGYVHGICSVAHPCWRTVMQTFQNWFPQGRQPDVPCGFNGERLAFGFKYRLQTFICCCGVCLVLGGEASVTMGTYVHRLHILYVVYVYRFLQAATTATLRQAWREIKLGLLGNAGSPRDPPIKRLMLSSTGKQT
jgi:hypothetical protein